MHLYTYVPIWLYSYTPMCLQRSPLRGAFVCLVAGFPMRWELSHIGVFVRGGDGALARTRVVAPGCAGDGVSCAGKFHPHPACLHAPAGLYVTLFSCVRLVSLRGYGRRHQRMFFFSCVFSGFMPRVFFWGGIKAVPAFLVCACGCAGRTMGGIKPYDFGRAGLPPKFLKRSVNE